LVNHPIIIAIHIISACLWLITGTILFFTKRNIATKYIGYVWRISMLFTAFSWFFIAHKWISWLHGFSIVTIITISIGIYFWWKWNWYGHNKSMLGAYIWIVIAFLFTLYPTRRLWIWIFENLHISNHESQLYWFYFFLWFWILYSLIPIHKFFSIKQ